jgi:hypothetical protein
MNVRDDFRNKTLRLVLAILAAIQSVGLTSPLTPPTSLLATAVSSSEVDLSWRPGEANVAGYKIFRNGILVATTTGKTTSYHDTMLAPSTTYTDAVAAYDYTGDTSGKSNSASAITSVVPPRACITPGVPPGAVALSPGDNIQRAIDRNPAGTTFYLNAGTYRLSEELTAKNNDAFLGACGATLNGSALLSSWTQVTGAYYEATGVPIQSAIDTRKGECDPLHLLCEGVQDLYFDDAPLVPVASESALARGKWYFDRANSKVYLHDNPAGHSVEIGLASAAYGNTDYHVTGVTIKNLIVEKFAPEGQNAAIGNQFPGRNWLIENNEVRFNHGAGINLGSSSKGIGNYVHDNGQKGIGGGTVDGDLVVNNEISFNNYAGYDCQWDCGGMKFGGGTTNLTVIGNYVHDNLGYSLQGNSGAPGLWCDVDCGEAPGGIRAGIVFANNYVANNGGSGIFCEISHYCSIFDNIVVNNGLQNKWGWGQGIAINETDYATVYGNIVTGSHIGIGGVQQDRGRGPFGTYEITNLNVHDNVVTLTAGSQMAAGLWTDDGDMRIFTSNNNHYRNNRYNGLRYNSTPAQWSRPWRWSVSQWKAAGNDTSGTFNR